MNPSLRFDLPMGCDGGDQPSHRLRPFGAEYRFQNRTFAIRIWCRDWPDALAYAHAHGLSRVGAILQDLDD